jgi:Mycobacterial 4 TMS phage holin, superfamily IV
MLAKFLTAEPRRPTLNGMRQVLPRAVVLLGSWAIGLLVAAWVVPHVVVSLSGFIVAVVLFSVAQAILSLVIARLPHGYASLLLGGTGLVLTFVALSLAALLTHGVTIRGVASWIAATIVVWLVTTVGAISLPDTLGRSTARSA